jgi:hypothetical protein
MSHMHIIISFFRACIIALRVTQSFILKDKLALIRNSWFTILTHKAFHDKTTMHILYQSRHAQKSLFRVPCEFSHLGCNSPSQTLIRKI